ncbi:MAG: ARPP-1 family domain-containing protein, partial [Thermodesulfobacteriota bacterium]
MEKVLENYMNQIRFGKRQAYRNMAVFPVIMDDALSPDYLILDEALQDRAIEITEVTEGGSVPELKLKNNSSRNVLVLDGEELVGAKQNRVINVTILIGPKRTVVIPVSCVEQGRWSYRGSHFRSEDRILASRMKARKLYDVKESLQRGRGYQGDQGRVWEGVEDMMCSLDCLSPTAAMSDVYEQKRGSLDEYLNHF